MIISLYKNKCEGEPKLPYFGHARRSEPVSMVVIIEQLHMCKKLPRNARANFSKNAHFFFYHGMNINFQWLGRVNKLYFTLLKDLRSVYGILKKVDLKGKGGER
jgi:hypothetical protein